MEAKTALVRANCTIHLNAESTIYVKLTFIIIPWNTELNDALSLDHGTDYREIFRVGLDNWAEAVEDFFHCLMELRLVWISCNYAVVHFSHRLVHRVHRRVEPILSMSTGRFGDRRLPFERYPFTNIEGTSPEGMKFSHWMNPRIIRRDDALQVVRHSSRAPGES